MAQILRRRCHPEPARAQQGREYDVAPDGRFLIDTLSDNAAAPITLIENWNPEATVQ